MKIKEFIDGYNKNKTEVAKQQYIKDNLKIVPYISFIRKDALAQNLINAVLYKYEDYKAEDGTIKRRRTNTVHINSTMRELFFCRLMIEAYTNLEVETDGFYEEYDMLKQSGILYELFGNYEEHSSLIPFNEIEEMRMMVRSKQDDTIFNYGTPQSYISNQIERIASVLGTTLKPVIEKISEQLKDLDENDIEKMTNKIEKIIKLVK